MAKFNGKLVREIGEGPRGLQVSVYSLDGEFFVEFRKGYKAPLWVPAEALEFLGEALSEAAEVINAKARPAKSAKARPTKSAAKSRSRRVEDEDE